MNKLRDARDEITAFIVEAYGLAQNDLKYIRGYENLIFSFEMSGREFIIRASWHQPTSQVLAEVGWIQFLHSNGIPVSAPCPSAEKRFVEELAIDGKSVSIVAFEKAPGHFLGANDDAEPFWISLGELIGKMHSLSGRYLPEQGLERQHFESDRFLSHGGILDPILEKDVIDEYERLKGWLLALPRDAGAYGMVHGDLNWGNYLIDHGRITVFDFDSCCHNWFAYDMAIAIYSLIWELDEKDAIDKLERLVPSFWKGYSQYHALESKWQKLMPELLRFHDYYLYVALKEAIISGNRTEDYPSMLEVIRARCESGISLNYFDKEGWAGLFNKTA